MAKWNSNKPAGFMAGQIPHGQNEPAYVEMYKGCSIHSYTDNKDTLRLVMLDRDGSVRHGTEEAMQGITRAYLEKRYNLSLVREIA